MKLKNILLTMLSIAFATLGILLLLGELQTFELITYIVKNIVGFVMIALAITFFPFSLNLSIEGENTIETLTITTIIIIIILGITYYVTNAPQLL